MFKKVLISLVLSLYLLTAVFVKPALAQTAPQWYHSEFPSWFGKVNDPTNPEDIFAERYTSAQVEWVFYGYFSFLLNAPLGTELAYCVVMKSGLFTPGGPSIINACWQEILDRASYLLTASVPNSQNLADTQSTNVFKKVLSENRPISGIAYARERLSRFGLVQEASAQTSGFGYQAAAPVKALWAAARDITYSLLVLALIIMAFMIMFRVKTSPQTVITIQSTLPKLIVGIILITFSYAIAGLMIDFMYVVIGLLSGILAGSGLFSAPNNTWAGMYADLSGSQLGSGLSGQMNFYMIFFIISLFANNIMGWASILIPGIGGILLFAVVYIAWVIILLKIIWALVKNFMTILLLIAAAPFMILSGVVGGSGFGGWLKTLAAHLAVYPAIGVLFAFAFFFLANSFPDWPLIGSLFALLGNAMPFDPIGDKLVGTNWVPPFTMIGTNVNMIWLATSLMILSIIPKTVEIIKASVSGKPFAYGSAIGAPLAAGAGVVAAPFGFVGQTFGAAQEQLGKSVWSKVSQEVERRIRR